MNSITLRNRWLTTYQQMQSTVHGPQPMLPLRKPALWKRMVTAGWVMYRAADQRRGHETPGIAFDVIVVALLVVLVVANIVG